MITTLEKRKTHFDVLDNISFEPCDFHSKIADIRSFLLVFYDPNQRRFGLASSTQINVPPQVTASLQLHAILPPLYPEWLGDRTFNEIHKVRFSYVGGEMARGIASVELV